MPVDRELTLADHVCLAIIAEGRTHGWAIVRLLAPDGEIGRIWSLSRPLTYRAIDRLADRALVTRTESGRRAELAVTGIGGRADRTWLRTPVDHLRDLRTEFLVKFVLSQRRGVDAAPLVAAQRRRLAAAIAALTDHEPDDVVDRWRRESALAADRFLAGLEP